MVAFIPELDDRPLELRKGYPGQVIAFWPKVLAVGNVEADESPAPSWRAFSPAGAEVASGSAAIDPVDYLEGTVSRLVATLDASALDYGEDFRIEFSWSFETASQFSVVRFSVVREPYVPGISLNDLADEIADARLYCERQAELLQGTLAEDEEPVITAETVAALRGVKAWVDVWGWIRARVREEGRIYPRLIVPRVKLEEVVRAQALYRLFLADSPREGERTHDLMVQWERIASQRFALLGPFEYDANDDGVADTEIEGPAVIRMRRAWV